MGDLPFFPSQIAPQLFLGNATNPKVISMLGITHCINASSGNEQHASVSYLRVQLKDRENQSILSECIQSTDFICSDIAQGGSSKGGRVLVYCDKGESRSTTLLAAYMMHEHGYAVQQALAHIRAGRPTARPNDGFRQQLAIWHSLRRLMVEPTGPGPATTAGLLVSGSAIGRTYTGECRDRPHTSGQSRPTRSPSRQEASGASGLELALTSPPSSILSPIRPAVFSKHKDWPWVWQPDLRQEIRVMTNWAELLDQGSPQGGETGLLSGGAHLLQVSDGAGCGPRDPILAREVLHCDDAFAIRAVLSKAECRQLIIAAEGHKASVLPHIRSSIAATSG
jgi:hypothetical protein